MIHITEKQKENNLEWLEALRSGKYVQGRNVLHNVTTNTFCCLGVDCHIAKVPIHSTNPIGAANFDWAGRVDCADPEHGWFVDRHGFLASLPTVDGVPLWRANDDGVPFLDIADAIENFLRKRTDQYKECSTSSQA